MNKIWVRIVAIILMLLMVFSVGGTLLYYLIAA
jgi:hypothetical protein